MVSVCEEYAILKGCFLRWCARRTVNKRIRKTKQFLETVINECPECQRNKAILNINISTELKHQILGYCVICEDCSRIKKALKQRYVMPNIPNDANPGFQEAYLLSMLIKFPDIETVRGIVKKYYSTFEVDEYDKMKTYFYEVFLKPEIVRKVLGGGALKEYVFKKVIDTLRVGNLITKRRLPMKINTIKWFLRDSCAPFRFSNDWMEWDSD